MDCTQWREAAVDWLLNLESKRLNGLQDGCSPIRNLLGLAHFPFRHIRLRVMQQLIWMKKGFHDVQLSWFKRG